MNKFRIALDMDDVIVDLVSHWEMVYRLKADIPDTEKIDVKEWDIHKAFNKLPKKEVYDMLNIPGMFLHCKPMPGAISGVNSLHNDPRFDVHILTVATGRTAYNEKLQWVEEHLGPELRFKTIGLSSGLFKAELACNYDLIVEDNERTLLNVDRECGCFRMLFKRRHNHMAVFPEHFDDAVDTWGELHAKVQKLWKENHQNKC